MGNVLVGGVGKTPTVLAITNKLRSEGFNIAVVSKGYAGEKLNLNNSPEIIPNDVPDYEAARYFGDEPTMISRLASVPVCVAKDRMLAVEYLLSKNPDLNYIIADDGIQSLHQFSEKKILVFDEATNSLDLENASTSMSLSIPKVCLIDNLISGVMLIFGVNSILICVF